LVLSASGIVSIVEIIAERLQQPHRQRLVLTRTRCDLRGVRGLALALGERGQRLVFAFEPVARLV
jgi:hypothetical protein